MDRTGRMDAVSEPVPRERMRASDAERETVVERLNQAFGEGRITLDEFDERVRAVWAARTYGDLDTITADLPSVSPAVLPSDISPRDGSPRGISQRGVAARDVRPRQRPVDERSMRLAARAWLAVSLINVLIWGIVCLSTWHLVYPWWVWVAGPWGAVILAGRFGGFGGTRHDD